MVPVQELDPMHRERDGGEILFHLSLQKVGSHLVQHVTEPVIDFREQDRLINACGVFEGYKLHGVAIFRLHGLAGDQPSDGGDQLTHVEMKVTGVHVMSPLKTFL